MMTNTGIFTQKEKELVEIAASIAAGCQPCTVSHVRRAREAGAGEAELQGAIRIALDVRDDATEIMAEAAHGKLDCAYPDRALPGTVEQPLNHLIALAAAMACNSAAGLEYHLAAARSAGATARQIHTALGLARSIRRSAAEKAEAWLESPAEPVRDLAGDEGWQNGPVPHACDCR